MTPYQDKHLRCTRTMVVLNCLSLSSVSVSTFIAPEFRYMQCNGKFEVIECMMCGRSR